MMRKFFFGIFIFLLAINWIPTRAFSNLSDTADLIVKIGSPSSASIIYSLDADAEEILEGVFRISVKNPDYILQYLSSLDQVIYAERNGWLEVSRSASDPWFVLSSQDLEKQWYLPKIQVPKAWETTTGSSKTIVAIVDTGINGFHEDLNDGRVIGGYMSYCQVVDALDDSRCLVPVEGTFSSGINSDDNGHGTIVAGIIGAAANNNRGIAGINWDVSLMPIKAMNAHGSGRASDVAKGIRWATDNSARVINLSLGGSGLGGYEVLRDAIQYAFNKGVLVIAAAGNDAADSGGDLNKNPVMPVCADGSENTVIGVAAVDYLDQKARFSNFGSNCIDISAPGTGMFMSRDNKQGVLSTYYDPKRPGKHDLYVYAAGTSMATPMVSGAAALMIDAFPNMDVRAIRDRLIKSVDNIDAKNTSGCGGSCAGQIGNGRLNVEKAVQSKVIFSDGTLVETDTKQIYLIERGLKLPVSDFVFGQRFSSNSVIKISPNELDLFPTGKPVPPSDGTLVKSSNSPTVYMLEGGVLRALSYLAFISFEFSFNSVATLPIEDIRNYPIGEDAPVISGVLMKAVDNPAVYILDTGGRHLLSYFVFLQRGFDKKPIAEFSSGELALYPISSNYYLYPPYEGTLLRGDQNPTVFLVIQGEFRPLNLAVFLKRNYSFTDVMIVPQSEIGGYKYGTAILE